MASISEIVSSLSFDFSFPHDAIRFHTAGTFFFVCVCPFLHLLRFSRFSPYSSSLHRADAKQERDSNETLHCDEHALWRAVAAVAVVARVR